MLKTHEWTNIGATAPLDAGPDDPGVVWVAMAALLNNGDVAVDVVWRPADAVHGGRVVISRNCDSEADARAWAAQMLSELSELAS